MSYDLERGTIVAVTWLDSVQPETYGWVGEGDAFMDGDQELLSVGLYIGETATHIRIAGDLYRGSEQYAERMNRPISIPKGCIVRVRSVPEDFTLPVVHVP
jgi:hypothetical protein